MACEVIADDLKVCQTCALFLANGRCDGCESCAFADDPSVTECWTVGRKIADRWAVGYMVLSGNGDDIEYDSYSTSPCDGCGSELHGERHGAAVLV